MPEKLLKDVTEENPDLSLPKENPDISPETLTPSYIKSAYIPSEPQEMLDLYAKRRYVEEKGAAAIRLLQKHNKLTPELANRFAPPEPELLAAEPRGISLFERLDTFLRGEPQAEAGKVAPSEFAQAEERLRRIPPSIEKPAGIEQVGRLTKGVAGGVVGTAEGMVGTAEWLSGGAVGRDLGNTLRQIGDSLRPADPNFADALASGFGSALTFAIPGFGISAGTARLGLLAPKLASWAGITTSSTMEAMTEAGSVYRNVRDKTGDIQKADDAAKYTFLWNMPLLLVTNKLGIFGGKGGALRRAVVSSQMEGLQEVLQEKIAGKAEQRRVTFGQYATAYGVGAITGAGIGGLAKYIDIGIKQLSKQTGQEENTLKQDIEIESGATGKPVEEILDDRLRMTIPELGEEERISTQAEADAMEQFARTAGLKTPTETVPTITPPPTPTITKTLKQGEGVTQQAGEVLERPMTPEGLKGYLEEAKKKDIESDIYWKRYYIEEDLKRGKIIPLELLKDYPDLVKQVKKAHLLGAQEDYWAVNTLYDELKNKVGLSGSRLADIIEESFTSRFKSLSKGGIKGDFRTNQPEILQEIYTKILFKKKTDVTDTDVDVTFYWGGEAMNPKLGFKGGKIYPDILKDAIEVHDAMQETLGQPEYKLAGKFLKPKAELKAGEVPTQLKRQTGETEVKYAERLSELAKQDRHIENVLKYTQSFKEEAILKADKILSRDYSDIIEIKGLRKAPDGKSVLIGTNTEGTEITIASGSNQKMNLLGSIIKQQITQQQPKAGEVPQAPPTATELGLSPEAETQGWFVKQRVSGKGWYGMVRSPEGKWIQFSDEPTKKSATERAKDLYTQINEMEVPQAPTKEPWETTKKEWDENVRDFEDLTDIEKQRAIAWYIKETGDTDIEEKGFANWAYDKRTGKVMGEEAESQDFEIKQALSEGKPVPPEVLKDYPNLVKQVQAEPVVEEIETKIELDKEAIAQIKTKEQRIRIDEIKASLKPISEQRPARQSSLIIVKKTITSEGYFSNGFWLIRPEFTPETLKKVFSKDVVKDRPEVEKELLEPLRNIIKSAKEVATLEDVTVFRADDGTVAGFNTDWINYFRKHIKDFNLKISDFNKGAIIYSGNKEAGLIMPKKFGIVEEDLANYKQAVEEYTGIAKQPITKQPAIEPTTEQPTFSTMEDVKNYIEVKAKEYGGKNVFLSSEEYQKVYPEILKVYGKEKTAFEEKGTSAMAETGIKYGDRVFYDVVSPFGMVEKLKGIVIERNRLPYVKLDTPTSTGKKFVRWHKGFRVEPTTEQPAMTHDQILTAIKEGKISTEEAKQLMEKEFLAEQPIIPKTGIERGGVRFISNAAIVDILKRLDAAQKTKTSPEEIKRLNSELANLLEQAQIKIGETQRIADAEGVTINDILTITLPDGRTQQINLARFDSSEGGLTQLDKIVSALGEAVRGKRTDKELRAEAEKVAANIGLTKVQLENLRKNIENADKLVVASGIVIKTLDENARLINDAILTNPANENLAPFLLETIGQQRDVLVTITQIGTEGGRLLRAFGLGVEASKQRVRGLDELLEGLKKGNISIRDFAIKYRKLEKIEQRNIFLKSPTISDAFLEAWINGLLSGMPTHTTNVIGNSTAILDALAVTRIAESLPWGSTPSGMTGAKIQGLIAGMADVFTILKEANKSIPQEKRISNETTQVFSLSEKLEGIEKLIRTLRAASGEESQKFQTKRKSFVGKTFGATGTLANAIDLMGEYIRIPGQALMTVDEFYKVINYRMELHAQAYTTALSEGLQGKDLTDRMAEIRANPPETIHLEAEGFAFYNTFSQELGRMGSAVSAFAESHVFAKITVPFVTISTNLMKYTFERTPLALMSQKVRADWLAGGMKRDMVEAKVAMGSMIMATAAAAAMAGLITGGGPRDPELRRLWLASGKKPYSIKIGDTHYSYVRIEPAGSLFGLVADFVEIAQNTDMDTASKMALAMWLPFVNVFLHKTWLTGVSGVFNAIQNPTTGGPKYVRDLFKTIMPRIGANFAKVIDPQIREVRGILDALIADTPGWSMTLPPKRDIFGNPQMYEGGYANLISPIYTATEKHDPVIDEILKQQVSLSMPANYLGGTKPPSFGELRPIHGVQLDPYQYDRLVQIVGKEIKSDGRNLHDTLAAIMKTPFYQAMSEGQDGGRAKIIRAVVKSFNESGKMKFLMENPAINFKIRQRKLQKQQALVPTIQ